MSIVLANAAFGDDPQRWPLPPASTSHELWLRAVAVRGARRLDALAMALAGSDQQAGADALIGLAADALGVGRFAASATALRRAGELLTGSVPPRLPVRLAWVSAE